jgi:hypothetical protein
MGWLGCVFYFCRDSSRCLTEFHTNTRQNRGHMKKCGYCGFQNDDAALNCGDCESSLDGIAAVIPASTPRPTLTKPTNEDSTEVATKTGHNLCPTCNYTVSHVVKGSPFPFYFKDRECQRCGCQWTPAYSRFSIAVFTVICLGAAVIVLLIDDSVYIHGNINAVSSDDKPIAMGGVFFTMAAFLVGIVDGFMLLRDPKVEIQRKGVWPPPPDKLTPQAGGTVGQSKMKKNEGQGAQ